MTEKISEFAPNKMPPALPTVERKCHSNGVFPVRDLSKPQVKVVFLVSIIPTFVV
jgi:hypothetical protein